MKIFDCFMYYDEDMILDLRLNYLNKYVDYFVIVESTYTHSGLPRKLLFNINNFIKFKNKIKYIVLNEEPKNLEIIVNNENEDRVNSKLILNAVKRENLQRNTIQNALIEASENDLVIVSDVDEIPNLENLNLVNIDNKIILFNQKYYYYKFTLKLDGIKWRGSKACLKKHLISPQWLRNVKDKIYPWWRVDIIFSNKKYRNLKIIENGGWHFSNIKSAFDIEKKMRTYLHHREYELNPLSEAKINEIIKEKKPIYNLKSDMKSNKFDLTDRLIPADISELPSYVQNNMEKFSKWID